jgi:Na+/phosphate symporter
MNYTAFTALIITFHHMAAITALILALCMSAMVFLLFIKRKKHRRIAILITFLASLIIGAQVAEEIFQRRPLSLEVVQAG